MNTRESIFHGQGTFMFNWEKTGVSFIKANWDNGEAKGQVEIVYNPKKGERYVGNYANQVRHGYGTYYVFDGFYVESRWKDGYPYGLSRIVYKEQLNFDGFIVHNVFYSLWNEDLGSMKLGWTCAMYGNCY